MDKPLTDEQKALIGKIKEWAAKGSPDRSKVNDWSVEEVARWALIDVKIVPRHVAILVKQEVDGRALLVQTKDDLRSYGLLGGPASVIFDAILALKPGA